MPNQEHICENCEYFIKHYLKTVSGKLQRIYGLGHCSKSNLHYKHSQKIIKNNLPCEYWQPEKQQIEKRQQNIFKLIKEMKAQLDDIALILNSDKS